VPAQKIGTGDVKCMSGNYLARSLEAATDSFARVCAHCALVEALLALLTLLLPRERVVSRRRRPVKATNAAKSIVSADTESVAPHQTLAGARARQILRAYHPVVADAFQRVEHGAVVDLALVRFGA